MENKAVRQIIEYQWLGITYIKKLKKHILIQRNLTTFASNNTCHGSRKITAPGQVFAFYKVAFSFNSTPQ